MEICTQENFSAQCGAAFWIEIGTEQALELKLKSVTPLPTYANPNATSQRRESFSMIFCGPREIVLPQSIYAMQNAEMGALSLFIVPIGPDGEHMQYEAIFN